MRVALPRRNDQKSGQERPVSPRPPPVPPDLKRGECVEWRLDLRSETHQQALLELVLNISIPVNVKLAHLHTSPRCTFASKMMNIAESQGADLEPRMREGIVVLRFCRELHQVWRQRRFRSGVQASASHEQSAGCSTARALRLLPSSFTQGIDKSFPLAIASKAPRFVVRACSVGRKLMGNHGINVGPLRLQIRL